MNTQELHSYLRRRERRLTQKINYLTTVDSRFSNLRLALFLGGISISFFVYLSFSQIVFLATVFLFIISFIITAGRHRRLLAYLKKFRHWRDIASEQSARSRLIWADIPYTSHDNTRHAGDDINLGGPRSLFQLLDTTVTEGGKKQLTDWLFTHSPDLAAVKKRGKIIKKLRSLSYFREKMRLLVISSSEEHNKIHTDLLLKWAEREKDVTKTRRYFIILSILALSTLLLFTLYITGLLPAYWIISFLIYVTIFYQTKAETAGIFDESYSIEQGFNSLSDLLVFLESYKPSGYPVLGEVLTAFQNGKYKPSRMVKKAKRVIFWATLSQKNPFVWILFNALVPWDFFFTLHLEKFKTGLRPALNSWLGALHRVEALNALANFGYLNPHYVFAEIHKNGINSPVFDAVEIGHPLIPESEKVRNNYCIAQCGDISLITGSNMSGKSTFLRTVAINIKLAMSGAPVDARSLSMVPLHLFTCINISDSLSDGISYFYAEVRRLKELLQLLDSDVNYTVCYCIDEIFRGTNNRERLQGSRALIAKLSEYPAVGLISTHDLELVQLEKNIPQLHNFHFKEHIEDGKMAFDYKLRRGPSPTTNALKIMQMEGLPIS